MKHPLNSVRESLSGRPVREVLVEIAEALRQAERCVVTAHAGPDGDALGSAAALALGLRRLGKQARAITADDIPVRFRPLFTAELVETVGPEELKADHSNVDWYVIVDTSEPERIGGFREVFFREDARRICIDHHRTHARGRHHHELIVPEAPATGSLILALLDELGVVLTADITRSLWVAIATDTGWFRFSNTGPWALLDAARLAEVPEVDVEAMYDGLYNDLSPERARLVGHVLSRVRVELDGALVWSELPLSARGAVSLVELDGVIDYLKLIDSSRIIALIVEVGENMYKVSLRARGDAEVEGLARHFGGGGHAKAAGCRFTGKLNDLVDELRIRSRGVLGGSSPS